MGETSRGTRAFDASTGRECDRASEVSGVVALSEVPSGAGRTEPTPARLDADAVTRAVGLPPRADTSGPTLPLPTQGHESSRDGATGGPRDGPEFLGRYENLGEIARGGMGRVHRVRDLRLNRELAFKVMLGHTQDPDLERRFLEEAQITGQLQHPGIPPVHEVGRLDDGSAYYTMKLIRGSTLADLLAARPGPAHELSRFVAAFEPICQALAYAHARGVVHRDLKPLNVMVGAFGEVQVMDWGLAKVLGRPADETERARPTGMIRTVRTDSPDGQSMPGIVMGTLAYMPPEQALGLVDRIDERSDVFALGSILCEILTGDPAYVGPTTAIVYMKSAGADLAEALARLDACGADAELIALTRECLAPDPEARPRDAGRVAASVSAYLAAVQERLRAAEIARVEATAKAEYERKRRRLMVALAATVVASIGLGSGGWIALNRLSSSVRESTAIAVGEAMDDADSWRERAESDPPGDLSAWEKAQASTRRAADLLRGKAMGSELDRRVVQTVAAIEEGRDGAQADVPGCIASVKRLRNRGDVPPEGIELQADGGRPLHPHLFPDGNDPWPDPDYPGFTILRSSAYLDLSRWRPIPAGTTPATAGRVEPALFTRVVDLIRKKNVSRDNSHITFPFRTEVPVVDIRCPDHGYKVRGSAGPVLVRGAKRPRFAREVEVDLSDVPIGEAVRVVIHATLWNAYQHGAEGKVRAAMLSPDDLSEEELAIRFPPGRKPASPPSLSVFMEESSREVVPATTQNFTNPRGQDWWVWRPRDIRKDANYQIEWDWTPGPSG